MPYRKRHSQGSAYFFLESQQLDFSVCLDYSVEGPIFETTRHTNRRIESTFWPDDAFWRDTRVLFKPCLHGVARISVGRRSCYNTIPSQRILAMALQVPLDGRPLVRLTRLHQNHGVAEHLAGDRAQKVGMLRGSRELPETHYGPSFFEFSKRASSTSLHLGGGLSSPPSFL